MPFGTRRHVTAAVRCCTDAALRLLSCIDRLLLPSCGAQHPDERDLLLRFTIHPRPRHLLRLIVPDDTPGGARDVLADFDTRLASARLSVVPSADRPTDVDPHLLQALPIGAGGHGLTPHVGPAGFASYHHAAYYGSLAAVWHYARRWARPLRASSLASRAPGRPLPYQAAAQDCWARLLRAHQDVDGLRRAHPTVLPSSVAHRFPEVASRLEDGRFSPATVPLGSQGSTAFDDAPTASSLLHDLDGCDAACHPHAQRAASAVVASHAFFHLFFAPSTTDVGRARLLDGSVGRGPSAMWRRIPVAPPETEQGTMPLSTATPLFAFEEPSHFPVALAVDLLLHPPVPGRGPTTVCSTATCAASPVIAHGERHHVTCRGMGITLHTVAHDPVVRALIAILDAVFGTSHVVGERGPGTHGVQTVAA